MQIMKSIIEELKRYFEETPRDQIIREWEENKYLNQIGSDVIEYTESMLEMLNDTHSSDCAINISGVTPDYSQESKLYKAA